MPTELFAVDEFPLPGGGTCVVSIAAPVVEQGDYLCEVTLSYQTQSKTMRILGVSSYQALKLAVRYVEARLAAMGIGTSPS